MLYLLHFEFDTKIVIFDFLDRFGLDKYYSILNSIALEFYFKKQTHFKFVKILQLNFLSKRWLYFCKLTKFLKVEF